jgi:hypothetical protein
VPLLDAFKAAQDAVALKAACRRISPPLSDRPDDIVSASQSALGASQ